MKCEVCLELLEEYLDAELAPEARSQVSEHLITCSGCASNFAALTAEQALFAHYDREIEVPPFLWTRIAEHSHCEEDSRVGWNWWLARFFPTPGSLFGGLAVILIAVFFGVLIYSADFRLAQKDVASVGQRTSVYTPPSNKETPRSIVTDFQNPSPAVSKPTRKLRVKTTVNRPALDQSDVLSSDLGYLDMDDQDTAKHIEQTQNLLRSIRNFPVSDSDEEIDVTYDKALSRRLLNENVVLRRDAEMKAKFPTKTLLADLEPFLIDIANLPDHARPEEVRVIKERVQKTEIVAALLDYQDRGTNNR